MAAGTPWEWRRLMVCRQVGIRMPERRPAQERRRGGEEDVFARGYASQIITNRGQSSLDAQRRELVEL